ncbi:hypothetical protein GOP47_0029054 [Adiantum capillus-veneris]|nr:hypothetical protein GOP47_0029054 [Adiantum capillus-veneris]
MWRLKQLIPKDQAGLEGKTVDVGSLRLQIRSTIAQGGFSRVYLARDAQSGKLIALKHIICIDSESLDLVKKEVLALKAFRGHPNIITLEAQSMYDLNGTKECFLAMEYCEKMMVDVLDNRGAGHYEEKQLLLMFRDVCNAVYALHSQTPPVAHRDLKAENLLLGSDGRWKLCDFGSISTNHRRFDKAADMGLEEDIIRKHTTPAYRAPEMWDLYRRDIICEKVDIWALGCLLYRMAYFKSAFDGESKLQILNGNYRLPELPKYSSTITGLIKGMLNSCPEDRPTAMQVWQRVNNALSVDCQISSPDRAPASFTSNDIGGNTGQSRQPSVMPTRAPPPPPCKNPEGNVSLTKKEPDQNFPVNAGKGGGLGSFWSTPYAHDASYDVDKNTPVKEKTANELISSSKSNYMHGIDSAASLLSESQSVKNETSKKRGTPASTHPRKNHGGGQIWDDDEHNRQHRVASSVAPSHNVPHVGNTRQSTKEGFAEFVADFENASIFNPEKKDMGAESLHGELESLRAELKQVQKEVLEISTKCEKLTSICGSQQLEIQQLKSTLVTANSQRDSVQTKGPVSQRQIPSALSSQRQERAAGPIWDVEDSGSSPGFSANEPQKWKAFNNDVPEVWGLNENDRLKTSTTYSTGVLQSSNHTQPAGWSEF